MFIYTAFLLFIASFVGVDVIDLTFKQQNKDCGETDNTNCFYKARTVFLFNNVYLVIQLGFKNIQIFLSSRLRKIYFLGWGCFFDFGHKLKVIKFSRSHNTVFIALLLSITSFNTINASECHGKFVNPVTDICWSCIFPLSIGPVKINTGGRRDTDNPGSLICQCFAERQGISKMLPGIAVGFWEPVRLIDVTRVPYCMIGLGGVKFTDTTLKHGTIGRKDGESGAKHSFYQAHWYVYPIMYWLELLADLACMEQAGIDVAYMTELDPQWNNDELAFITNPEAVLFSNHIAQSSCGADCQSATINFPRNELFWCGGCQGSLYPFTGNVTNHYGAVQASQLIAQKMIAKLHRQFILWETSGEGALCEKQVAPKIKKDQYKLQMTYPIPDGAGDLACNPLGHSTVITESGKEFPYKGEDFGYLVWRKRNCCIF